jgi:hypothetical protein
MTLASSQLQGAADRTKPRHQPAFGRRTLDRESGRLGFKVERPLQPGQGLVAELAASDEPMGFPPGTQGFVVLGHGC